MNPMLEKQRALGHMRPCIGGDSSTASTSIQQTVTNVTDARSTSVSNSGNSYADSGNTVNTNSNNTSWSGWSVGGDASNFGNTVSNTSITYTDQGAVKSAMDATTQNTGIVMALADKLATGATNVAQKNAELTSQLTNETGAAYASAAKQANSQSILILVGLTVVALAFILHKR